MAKATAGTTAVKKTVTKVPAQATNPEKAPELLAPAPVEIVIPTLMEISVTGREIEGFEGSKPRGDRSTRNGWRQVGMISTASLLVLTGGYDGETYDAKNMNVESFQRARLGFGARSYKHDLAADLLVGRQVPTLIVYQMDGVWYLEDGQQRTDSILQAMIIAAKLAGTPTAVPLTAAEKSIYDAAVETAGAEGLEVLTFAELVEEMHGVDIRGDYTREERLRYFDLYNTRGAKVTTRHIVEAKATESGWADRFTTWGLNTSTERGEKEESQAAKAGVEVTAKPDAEKMGLLMAAVHAYATGDPLSGVKDMAEPDARAMVGAKLDTVGDDVAAGDFRWLFSKVSPDISACYPTEWIKKTYTTVTGAPSAVKQFRAPAELMMVATMAALGKARLDALDDDDVTAKIEQVKKAFVSYLETAKEEATTDPLVLNGGAGGSLMEYYDKIKGAVGGAQRKLITGAFYNMFTQGKLFRAEQPLNWRAGA
jgi:hypothetical protein